MHRGMMVTRRSVVAGLASGPFWGAGAQASTGKTLTWSGPADAASLDPYAFDETFTLGFLGNIYEGLIERGPDMEIRPALATEWRQIDPKRWRFVLRRGVTFHGGEPFDADDVVFSVRRASSQASRVRASKMASVAGVEKVDSHTVDILLSAPNPILVADWGNWYILSSRWAQAHGISAEPTPEEITRSFASTNANGTGPYRIVERQPDNRTVAVAHAGWWGRDRGNVERVVYRPIRADATRTAALVSGEIQVAVPVVLQDQERVASGADTDLLTGPELRTMFFGFDVGSPELPDSDVKGRNPFADRRVRQAVYQAIDAQAIHRAVMRGQATVTAALVAPAFTGFPSALQRYPFDPAKARSLLAEAGYPEGFSFVLETPNNRYVNDERIAVAVAGMLARVGLKVRVFAMPRTQFFERVLSPNPATGFWFMGLSPGNIDAVGLLKELAHSRTGPFGTWNAGRLADPRLDRLIEDAMSEADEPKRLALLAEAQQLIHDQVYFVPLHQQALSWGRRKTVGLKQRPDDVFVWKWVSVA